MVTSAPKGTIRVGSGRRVGTTVLPGVKVGVKVETNLVGGVVGVAVGVWTYLVGGVIGVAVGVKGATSLGGQPMF